MGASGLKVTVGGISLVTGSIPFIGEVSDWATDGAELLVGTGEVYLKEKAAEARVAQMETRSMDMYVEVEVTDSEGYYDRDYLIFEMEYLWEKEG